LGPGEPCEDVVEHVLEQVADDAVRERRLLLRRARPQDDVGQLTRGLHPGAPKRGLADPWVALDQERTGTFALLEERGKRLQFFISTDDLGARHCPPGLSILAQWRVQAKGREEREARVELTRGPR
jgi:hypothetical protein